MDKEDIDMAIDRLTQGNDSERVIENEEKNHIITVVSFLINIVPTFQIGSILC